MTSPTRENRLKKKTLRGTYMKQQCPGKKKNRARREGLRINDINNYNIFHKIRISVFLLDKATELTPLYEVFKTL